MQCWQCGADVQPGQRTCGYCGARLTAPPAGRSQRPSQQRQPPQPSPRNAPRRPRDDGHSPDYSPDYAPDYAAGYPPEDSAGDAAYPPDNRGGGRRGSRGRPRSNQATDDYGDQGEYRQPGYDQPGDYDEYASEEYDAPDPLNDPRAPRGLRSSPRRGPDPRRGRPPGDGAARYAPNGSRDSSRDGSRDDWQQEPDRGDNRSRRSPSEAGPNRRRDDDGSRGGGYGPESMLPPLTQERQGYAPDSYGSASRSRGGQPSSADNRYGRSSGGRGRSSSYADDAYDDNDAYGDEYGDGYGERPNGPRQGYGRRMSPDARAAYQQGGMQPRSWQQRWGETIGSVRIPGLRPQQETSDGKAKPRRIVTAVVMFVVLAAVLGAGIVIAAPRILQRIHPSVTTSALCSPGGPATNGAIPTPPAHFKQFTSTRSRYGVNYPETWTVEPQQKAAAGYDYIDLYTLPTSSTLVSIEQPEAVCAFSDVNIIQGEVAAAQHQNIAFAEDTSAATTQTIGGEKWQRREYDVTDKGVALHMVILACHHQGRAYVIVLVSKTTTFSKDDTGIFEPMLKSFTFTK